MKSRDGSLPAGICETVSGVLCSLLDNPAKKDINVLKQVQSRQDGAHGAGGETERTGFVQPE